VEAADFSVLGFVLIQELQVRLVEFFEEVVAADFYQGLFLRAEINPKEACMAASFGSLHSSWHAIALAHPFFDLGMVRRGVAFAHGDNLLKLLVITTMHHGGRFVRRE
jgi:hypothetical protein